MIEATHRKRAARLALHDAQLLYINGSYTKASAGVTFPVKDPMTGEVLFDCAAAQTEDYLTAITAAHDAFKSWSQTPPTQRRRILLKAADILDSYLGSDRSVVSADEILSAEVSATKAWVELNVRASANFLRDSASLATQIKGEVLPADRPNSTVLVLREPIGVILSICPWNAPVSEVD